MNLAGLKSIINFLSLEEVNLIEDADIVYSASSLLDTEAYPNKIFIFGPHFSIFPNTQARQISGKYKNSVYIQPSQPSVDTWVKEFNYTNVHVEAFPFPVSMPEVSKNEKTEVLLYYKSRSQNDLNFIKNKLHSLSVNYHLINYGSYDEKDYQALLDKARFIVWVGCHESQGFALESALAKNIPILVWSVTKRTQQTNCPSEFYTSGFTPVTTIPYWDTRCGIYFTEENEFDKAYENFIDNLTNYRPRSFVNEVLSVEACSNRFLKLIEKININKPAI